MKNILYTIIIFSILLIGCGRALIQGMILTAVMVMRKVTTLTGNDLSEGLP
jgi:hypothetical protein